MLKNISSNRNLQKNWLLFIYNSKSKDMMWWKKSSEENNEEINYTDYPESTEGIDEVGIGELTGIILDYYCTTGEQPMDSGDEWKKGTEHEPKPTAVIPGELDEEIKKAFMTQIKKFQ